MGYKEVLGGKDDVGGPNQANSKALSFILWCPKAISEWFENPVILGLINELGLTPLPPLQTMSAFLTVFFVRELPLTLKDGFDLSSDEEIRGPYPYFINSSFMYQMEISLSSYVEKETLFMLL